MMWKMANIDNEILPMTGCFMPFRKVRLGGLVKEDDDILIGET